MTPQRLTCKVYPTPETEHGRSVSLRKSSAACVPCESYLLPVFIFAPARTPVANSLRFKRVSDTHSRKRVVEERRTDRVEDEHVDLSELGKRLIGESLHALNVTDVCLYCNDLCSFVFLLEFLPGQVEV
jgi:hypothetical protein